MTYTLSQELQRLSGIALAHGLSQAYAAIKPLIEAAELADNPPPATTEADMEALFADIEKLVEESISSVVKLDSQMSNRFADTVLGIPDEDTAIAFARRVMIDLRVLPQQTGRVILMDTKLSAHLIETLAA
ncbi:MAG: hypothetical protein DI537_42390 [Stutzerimonas stutzeri]|nr:MAG: hypothetical protein DI537_42390 [Stutzerimonas stutzeri]